MTPDPSGPADKGSESVITAYKKWWDAPFPDGHLFPDGGPDDDAVEEAHTDLATWDAFVADDVIPVIEDGAPFRPHPTDLAVALADFIAGIDKLVAISTPGDVARLTAYRAYALLALDLYEEVRKAALEPKDEDTGPRRP